MTSYSVNAYGVTDFFCCFRNFLGYTLFLPSFIVVRHQMAELNLGACFIVVRHQMAELNLGACFIVVRHQMAELNLGACFIVVRHQMAELNLPPHPL